MQHIVHVFIGDELADMRDRFASLLRQLHPDVCSPYLTILSLTVDPRGEITLRPDSAGDPQDEKTISADDRLTAYHNYFESLYSRKVTVATPGNQSMVVMIWSKLFIDRYVETVETLIEGISGCTSNLLTEVSGFTHDSVSAFISDPAQMLAPEIYRGCFEKNISSLRAKRHKLSALRLIANRNLNNVALGFDCDAMARACAEMAALLSRHYLTFKGAVVNGEEVPYESFGISAIKFDRGYYRKYLLNRIIIDAAKLQEIDRRRFNINALAQKSNPVLGKFIERLRGFYSDQVANARAQLALGSDASVSNIVGQIDEGFQQCVADFRKEIDRLTTDSRLNIFEREALLSLILGDDSPMFDTSAVSANEIVIDDILDESSGFFLRLDPDNTVLMPVKWAEIRKTRNDMRNIAVANRQRQQRLEAIERGRIEAKESAHHYIDGGAYRFDGVSYKLDLSIDPEPLEQIYRPHEVKKDSVDLRGKFAAVRNQGPQGCCASFAVASVIEALRNEKEHYSPAFLYWNAREAEGTTGVDSGSSIYAVIKAATSKGDCPEQLMPYDPAIYNLPPDEKAIAAAAACRVKQAMTVAPTVEAMRSALADGYPVIIAARIFDSFSDTRGGFVRRPSRKEVQAGERSDGHGFHAMVVCGYSDREKVFVVRNSWGKRFGDKGYCYVPYSYAEKYFLQACIITGLTSASGQVSVAPQDKVLEFNLNDSNIEYAVIQNLIDEDNDRLEELTERYNRLKARWTQNVATLGNVNNQQTLIEEAKARRQDFINRRIGELTELQDSKEGKLKEFKKNYIKSMLISGGVFLVSLLGIYLDPSLLTFIGAGVTGLIFASIVSLFAWRYKVQRQQLIDEIQEVANDIDRLRERKQQLELKAHIHSEILKNVGNIKYDLAALNKKQRAFNFDVVKLFEESKRRLADMKPTVPYPFLTIVDNDCLSRYFSKWRQQMVSSLDFNLLLQHYDTSADLFETIASNPDVSCNIDRGLTGFSMREYVARTNPEKWQFLPADNSLSTVLPDLDQRATPFCPYAGQVAGVPEKYLFVKDLGRQQMSAITPWFLQAPMPVDLADPDSIYLMAIVRFNL